MENYNEKKVKQVCLNEPMSQINFNHYMEGQLQQIALYDVAEQREILKHRRGMERAEHRSRLREQEYVVKQNAKIKKSTIYTTDTGIMLQIVNGLDLVISEQYVFRCKVCGVYAYMREESNKHLWQVCLKDGNTGETVISPLYEEEILYSVAKLKKTIFLKYDCAQSEEARKVAWKWLRKQLVVAYEEVTPIRIPFKVGWFQSTEKWHFWTSKDKGTMLLTDFMKEFSVVEYRNVTAGEIFGDIAEYMKNVRNERVMAVLLIIRLIALLGRMTTETGVGLNILIVGEQAEEVAKVYLRTMHNSVDIVNLDADRISIIREHAKKLQDTPLIFVIANPDSKSTQNRMKEVMSWMNAGYVEGMKVNIPYVFCSQRISKEFPFKETIVLDVNENDISLECDVFDKLQSFIISLIENSGEYWSKKLTSKYIETKQKKVNVRYSLIEAVVGIVLMMIESAENNDNIEIIKQTLKVGLEEIEKQFKSQSGIIVNSFQQKIIELVDVGNIVVVNKEKVPVNIDSLLVFYDQEYYYFTKYVLQHIGTEARFDSKSMLFMKQQLVEQGVVKLYRYVEGHKRDLEIDFIIYNAYGEKKRLSGFAIKRSFWDELGGIDLYERGRNNA